MISGRPGAPRLSSSAAVPESGIWLLCRGAGHGTLGMSALGTRAPESGGKGACPKHPSNRRRP